MAGNTFDVIVVGAGIMGTATAYQLAKRGARVLLLEQFTIGHALGSSHGPHRIIRLAYDTRDYVVLAQSAYALWHELEQDAGQSLLIKTGGLDFGAPDALGLREIGANYADLGIAYDAVDAAEIHKRFPQILPPDGSIGFYQADYSMLAADKCVATAAARARHYGAVIHESEGVLAIEPHAAGVTVRTAANSYSAAKLVLSAGSWMRPMLLALGIDIPLIVTKEQVAFMGVHRPEDFMVGAFPLFIHRFPGSTQLGSGFPLWGHRGPKVMFDRTGPEVDPADLDRTVNPQELARLERYAAQTLAGLTGEVLEVVSCRYTMTPDEDFVIDTHPEHKHIVLASPCSGHGFKFGSVIGEILADLALTGATGHNIARFKVDRPALTR